MDAITQLQGFGAVWLYICAFIASTAGAAAVVVKFWRFLRRDTDNHETQLTDINRYLNSDKRRIEELEERQSSMEVEQRMQLKALMTMMSHFLDGNHTSQLTKVRDEINTYLIER